MTVFSYTDEDVQITSECRPYSNIDAHLGMAVSNVTAGRHIGKDFLAGLRNVFGGRSGSWEKSLAEAQKEALDEIVEEAKKNGADALVAVTIEDELVGSQGGMMNVKASGTMVTFKKT